MKKISFKGVLIVMGVVLVATAWGMAGIIKRESFWARMFCRAG